MRRKGFFDFLAQNWHPAHLTLKALFCQGGLILAIYLGKLRLILALCNGRKGGLEENLDRLM